MKKEITKVFGGTEVYSRFTTTTGLSKMIRSRERTPNLNVHIYVEIM